MDTLNLALANLLSIPVLAFVLAVIASRIKSDIRLPDAVYQGITIFLLVGIGIKGGHAIKSTSGTELLFPILATLALGIVIPLIAYALLSVSKRLSRVDKGSLSAHYGSTSLVTFAAGLAMLESVQVFVEPSVATLLAIMEVPGLIVGIFLGTFRGQAQDEKGSLGATIREVFLGKTVFLLVGALLIGYIAPESSFTKVEPFFVVLQSGVLVLFLLQLGFIVGERLGTLRQAGLWLPVFAILMPLIGGSLGATTGALIGMSTGGATMLAVLCASASYIAAPAAVSIALPKANLSLSLTASLGITFPFNLLVGLPLYLAIAQGMEQLV